MEITTKSARETQKLGQKIGHDLKGGDIVALYGELGSGKTTFVKGLARGLGIKGRIISPTFIFVRQYKISPPRRTTNRLLTGHLGGGPATTSKMLAGTPARCNISQKNGRNTSGVAGWSVSKSHDSPDGEGNTGCNLFYHIDLYRIEKFEQTKGLGLEEILSNPNAIIAIEWAEKIKKILPKKRIDIFFEYISEKERKIKII